MLRLFLSFLFLIVFSVSCQTIHYTNKSEVPHQYTYTQWHHIGLLGLIEFSSPVNVKAKCGEKGWKAVRTQKNVLQALTAGLVSSVVGQLLRKISPTLGILGNVYSPEEVSVACNNS